MALGLPNITIIFKGLAASAIERSERGIVACIIKDDTEGGQRLSVYESILDIDFEHMTEANYGYLKLLFEGGPVRVIVLRESAESPNLAAALKELMYLRWNYLCYPDISDEDKTTLAAWIKEMRDKNHKTFKAVLAASASDHEGIINLTTDGDRVLHYWKDPHGKGILCTDCGGLSRAFPVTLQHLLRAGRRIKGRVSIGPG